QEEILTMPCHPWANTQFSIPIAGRNIDMIDAVFEEDVKHTVCLCLGGAAERRRTKERDCAQVSSASKRSFLNHGMFLSHVCLCHICSCKQTTRDTRVGSRASYSHTGVIGMCDTSTTAETSCTVSARGGRTWRVGEGSRRRPLSPGRGKRGSQSCGQLRCHEGITAADVGAEVLRRIAIHELPTKHGMGHATDFVLNSEQLAACLGMDNVLEAVLVVIAFLGDQTTLLQERVRTREVCDVHGEVVPIIFRNFFGRFAENETLLGADLHPHRSGVHVLR